ncbi:hypothetical protein P7K49_026471 [Saguinus oedipus]|uniref:Uncharacterized protein n=1 Tax=Saguinus oedipus TaxID=9490 RepID=A0ABQ9UE78_SAGOE|nr:hypothetical protein P7K49_026471 [Saguinus oedipus]
MTNMCLACVARELQDPEVTKAPLGLQALHPQGLSHGGDLTHACRVSPAAGIQGGHSRSNSPVSAALETMPYVLRAAESRWGYSLIPCNAPTAK